MLRNIGALVVFVYAAFCLVLLIYLTRKGKFVPKIRRLAAIDGIEQVVGRCTEMGAKVHFTPGWDWSPGLAGERAGDFMAGLQVLDYVAYLCAKYNTALVTTVMKPELVAVSEDITRSAYLRAGKPPDEVHPDVRFLSTEQLPAAAGVLGIMARENVRGNIMIGFFGGAALIMAEAAFNLGAVQVGGVTEFLQAPFFVAACDYALIGEEVYAAGAYLSEDPVLRGSIQAQDFVKFVVIPLIILGAVLQTLGVPWLGVFLKS